MRGDLVEAHTEAWRALARPGTWWDGHQRRELAVTALLAMTAADPLPAWVAPSTVPGALPHASAAPAVAHDALHRIAAHAGTLTEHWYRDVVARLGERGDLAYVELVAIASTVAAVASFRRAAGLPAWELPPAAGGAPSCVEPPGLEPASLNWVRVVGPADERAAVVQAYTSVPDEHERLWRLADAQYMPDLEMVDPRWTRGTLTRPQMELIAARVSQLRECFY